MTEAERGSPTEGFRSVGRGWAARFEPGCFDPWAARVIMTYVASSRFRIRTRL